LQLIESMPFDGGRKRIGRAASSCGRAMSFSTRSAPYLGHQPRGSFLIDPQLPQYLG
jgi:hypothetical protein